MVWGQMSHFLCRDHTLGASARAGIKTRLPGTLKPPLLSVAGVAVASSQEGSGSDPGPCCVETVSVLRSGSTQRLVCAGMVTGPGWSCLSGDLWKFENPVLVTQERRKHQTLWFPWRATSWRCVSDVAT